MRWVIGTGAVGAGTDGRGRAQASGDVRLSRPASVAERPPGPAWRDLLTFRQRAENLGTRTSFNLPCRLCLKPRTLPARGLRVIRWRFPFSFSRAVSSLRFLYNGPGGIGSISRMRRRVSGKWLLAITYRDGAWVWRAFHACSRLQVWLGAQAACF